MGRIREDRVIAAVSRLANAFGLKRGRSRGQDRARLHVHDDDCAA